MPNNEKYEGMTVNERLYALGLFPEFDRAATSRDRVALVRVLVKARLSEEQANSTALGPSLK